MAKLQLFDESFDSNRSESYELSIQFSLNGFSFCITDTVRNYHIALVSNDFENSNAYSPNWRSVIQELITQFPIISHKFRRVQLGYDTQCFTLVPLNYFEPSRAKDLLELTCTLNELDEVRFNSSHSGMFSVFSIPTQLVSEWLKIQPHTKVRSLHEPILLATEAILKQPRYENTVVLYLGTVKPIFILISNRNITHCGSLGSTITDDIAYHTINICQNFNCNVPTTSVFITGVKPFILDLKAILERYFKTVEIGLPVDMNQYTYQLFEYHHQFTPLFNLSLCE